MAVLLGTVSCASPARENPSGTDVAPVDADAQTEDRQSPTDAGRSADAGRSLDASGLVDAGLDAEADSPSTADASASDASLPLEQDAARAANRDASAECASPRLACDALCVDPSVDEAHCGGCHQPCPLGFGCQGAVCVAEVGCSDGTREAFTSRARHPTIAGCAATWPLSSMRAAPTGSACGDEASTCAVPADACAAGWHVCGNPGGPEDLSARISHAECYAASGRWAAALGDLSCTECGPNSSGAVCCGNGCVQQEGSCVWPRSTAWFGVVDGLINRCSAIAHTVASPNVGVLCCRS